MGVESVVPACPAGLVESVVPACPAGLAVNKQDFLKVDFTVDNFFIEQNVKDTPLDTLRDDLGIYLKVLRSSMIELINEDYADFVNLSTNLVGLDTSIEKLKEPLLRVQKEVGVAETDIQATLDRVQNLLKEQADIREKKASLSNLQEISDTLSKVERMLGAEGGDTIPSDVTERIAGDINFLLFSSSKMKDCPLIKDMEPRISSVCDRLNSSLDITLIQAIQKGDVVTLGKCCRTYATIDRISSAEQLENHAHGLKGLLKEALNLIPQKLSALVELTREDTCLESDSSLKGFHFLVNAFWPEIWRNIKENLNLIFSPGNPSEFYKYYMDSNYFLSEFESYLMTEEAVKRFRVHPAYKEFNSSWNLPVYFQIRFQEIAAPLETALEIYGGLDAAKSHEQLKLAASEQLIAAINSSFHQDIYLRPLGDKFIKLSFQAVARYIKWAQECVVKFNEGDILVVEDLGKDDPAPGTRSGLAKSSTAKDLQNLQVINKTHRRSASDQMTQINQEKSVAIMSKPTSFSDLVLVYIDVGQLSSIIPQLLVTITKQFIQYNLQPATDSTRVSLEAVLPEIETSIINYSITEPLKLVKQVADIPRMYRRTNRDTPSKPCQYINTIVTKMSEFRNHQAIVQCPHQSLENWLLQMTEKILEVYIVNVTDVLANVTKMEESLKKLKKVRERGGAGGQGQNKPGTQGLSDDDKIRVQLYIDVMYFIRELGNLGVGGDVKNLAEIQQVVEKAAAHILHTIQI